MWSLCIKIKVKNINFEKLDDIIRKNVPSGFNVRNNRHENYKKIAFDSVIAPFDRNRAELSVGTLGGGNHFISIEQDSLGDNYLLIHSGSRYFGNQIAKYYQNLAIENVRSGLNNYQNEIENIIKQLKTQGREREINDTLKQLKVKKVLSQLDKDFAYLQGEDMQNYLHDMGIAQSYANYNRLAIAQIILENMNWEFVEKFDSIHNYIDLNHMILRKGAVSAQKGEKLIIPINMRDGSIIAIGKGNKDWNCTAPHGAGRLYSRSKAKELFNVSDFEKTMKGIYTTSVSQSTLDECPMSYKNIDDIVNNIQDTVDIEGIIKPIYNYKA